MATIEFDYIKVSMNQAEANAVFWAFIHEFKRVIGDEHYRKYPEYFYESQKTSLAMAERFAEVTGMLHCLNETLRHVDAWIKEGKKQ